MTFLNPALIFGAVAVLIPLVIHILNRSRFRTVDWGAMHLLESVLQVNHKRFRLDQLILLLVRCAIPVLLAFCLARPIWSGARSLEGNAPASIVILLDNSYSMDVVEPTGTRFQDALDAATKIVEASARGSEIAVFQTGGLPRQLFDRPIFDADAVVRKLKQVPSGLGASQFQDALNEALATLAAMSHARRELLIISDFQSSDWKAIDAATIQDQIAALDIKPEVTLLQIGDSVSDNVSIDSLTFPQRALGVQQQLDLRVNVRSHGLATTETARLGLYIDGQEEAVTQVNLTVNGTSQAYFPCQFKTPGSHLIEVKLTADDSLATDNRYAAAVTVWDRLHVLLVDGAPSQQPLQGETDYLSIALTPLTFGRLKLADLVDSRTITAQQLDQTALDQARVVVLANVVRLNSEQLELLSNFVQNGGALLVSAGNQLDLAWYREKFFADGKGLLPLPFHAPQGVVNGTEGVRRIVSQRFDHPALTFFNDRANGDLSTAEIQTWCPLDERTAPGDQRLVLARLDNGEPLLVEHPFGTGVVVQFATSCDADWTNFPLRPVFVPFMQQLVTTLAARISPPRNILTGTPAVALLDATEEEVSISVQTPDGSLRSLKTTPQGNRQLARFDETQRPGVYVMSTPAESVIHFAAEASRDESDLTILNADQLNRLADDMGASIISSAQSYLEQDRLRRHGREIWQFALAAVLCFLFLELVLQQRFAQVGT